MQLSPGACIDDDETRDWQLRRSLRERSSPVASDYAHPVALVSTEWIAAPSMTRLPVCLKSM